MAKQYEDKADWQELDPTALAPKLATAYEQYKALYKQMKAARVQFEDMMQSGVPEGKRMVFGYRFGKLSVAIVEGREEAPKAATKGKLTLAQFLQAAQANGGRA